MTQRAVLATQIVLVSENGRQCGRDAGIEIGRHVPAVGNGSPLKVSESVLSGIETSSRCGAE